MAILEYDAFRIGELTSGLRDSLAAHGDRPLDASDGGAVDELRANFYRHEEPKR